MRVGLILFFLVFCKISIAQESPERLRQNQFNLDNGWALQQYDAVSYFSGKPLKGTLRLSVSFLGVKYAFANEANLAAFKKEPSKYEPKYGGWCAYAMGASGEKVEVDPETFKIIDNKLYLFYHTWSNNTLNKWNKAEQELKSNADKNWKKFYK